MPYHRSVDQPKSCSKAPWSLAWYEVGKVAAAGLGGVAPVAATVRSPCTTDLPRPHSCSITTSLEQCDGGEVIRGCGLLLLYWSSLAAIRCRLCLLRKNQPLLMLP
ncbi:hypothetical protein C1H46_000563 [Malus baccata]|uniref:Uncharacterized protein n=1 Tax=Malus baccata TaxID=106549 RepID=A0A540NSB7_MALBA|nr:hypothetical protein C1H46_000563 [Malus baccata]